MSDENEYVSDNILKVFEQLKLLKTQSYSKIKTKEK